MKRGKRQTRLPSEREIVKRIARLHETRQPLNISAVKRHSPKLLAAAFSRRPFLGWRRALKAAGLDYSRIKKEIQPHVVCQVCGESFVALPTHLQMMHLMSPEEYQASFPGAELFAEEYHARRCQFQYSGALPHWEPFWTPEYILDRVHAYHEAGYPVFGNAVSDLEPALFAAANCHREQLGDWDNVLRQIGLVPDRIKGNPDRLKRKPPAAKHSRPSPRRSFSKKTQVLAAIRKRHAEKLPLGLGEVSAGKHRHRALASAAQRLFGNWDMAVRKAGFDPKENWVDARIRYPRPADACREIKRRRRRGQSIRVSDVQQDDQALYRAARRHFGTWPGLLKACGINLKKEGIVHVRFDTPEKTIAGLQARAADGQPLNHKAIHDEAAALLLACNRHFGSYDEALRQAGIDPDSVRKIPRSPYPSRESIVAAIRKRRRKKQPLNSSAIQKGKHSDPQLSISANRRFGNWTNALEAAGIDPATVSLKTPSSYQSAEDVVREIKRRKRGRLGLKATQLSHMVKDGGDRMLLKEATRIFGGWDDALRAAGLDPARIRGCNPNPYRTKADIVRALKERLRAGQPMTGSSAMLGPQKNSSLYNAVMRAYHSWPKALAAAKISLRETYGPVHQLGRK